jgi:hypothetical protein
MRTEDGLSADDAVVYIRDKNTGEVTAERRQQPHWARRPVFVMLVVATAFLTISAIRLALTV